MIRIISEFLDCGILFKLKFEFERRIGIAALLEFEFKSGFCNFEDTYFSKILEESSNLEIAIFEISFPTDEGLIIYDRFREKALSSSLASNIKMSSLTPSPIFGWLKDCLPRLLFGPIA